MTSHRKQVVLAALATLVSIGVAVAVNLLTSGWSWLIFLVLAVLSGTWVGLESWRAKPRRTSSVSLGPAGPNVLGGFVPRPELADPIVRTLLAGKTRTVGITTALTGAGGFGKTTLAEDVCSRTEIVKAFPQNHFISVGQELRGAALANAINDVSENVDGPRPGLTSPEQAGNRLGQLLKEKGRSLLVVDDIWTAEQLRPFLNAGRGCTLLVTTRFPELLPDGTKAIKVDQMDRLQARDLVAGGLALPAALSDQLLDITGRWPLALSLTNGALRRAARDGADVTALAERLLERLQKFGPAALDVTDAARRSRTVAATLESSFSLLGDRRERVVELGIFPEDIEIPVDLAASIWQATAGLSRDESDELCRELADMSLVVRSSGHGALRLHDVIRAYLRNDCGAERITALHGALLDKVASGLPTPRAYPAHWWQLPDSAEYLWRSLSYHLAGAGRDSELATLVTEPHWVIRKLRKLGPVAVAEDLASVNTGIANELSRFLDQLGHLLTPTEPEHAVVNALAQRLPHTPAFAELRRVAADEVADLPRLVPYRELPDMPDPAIDRVLRHENDVEACAFTPDGTSLLSASRDGLRVWDAERGQLTRLVVSTGSAFDSGFTLSPSGKLLVAEGSDDKSVQILETGGWQTKALFTGHSSWLTCCCFSADERSVISAGMDNTVRIWDIEASKQLRVIKTPNIVEACASLADGRIVLLEDDRLRIWDPTSGSSVTLPGAPMFLGNGLVVSPDQRWAVVPGDDGVAVHDLNRIAEPPRLLGHHGNQTCAAFSPDGMILATGSESGTITLWTVSTWQPVGQIPAYIGRINKLAFSPNGTTLASAGNDATVRLWNPARAQTAIRAPARNVSARACAAAPNGAWLAVSTDTEVTIHDGKTTKVKEVLEFPASVRNMTSLASGYLAVQLRDQVVIREKDNWHSSRTLVHPSDDVISNLSTGGNLVCVGDDRQIIVWNVETWASPVYLVIGGPGLRSRDKPLPHQPPLRVRILGRLRGPVRRMRRSRVGQRLNQWLSRQLFLARKHARDLRAEISPDGDWIAVATRTDVHIASTHTWEPIAKLPLDDDFDGMCVVPERDWLAVGCGGGVKYWNTKTWRQEQEFIDTRSVESDTYGAWSPDGALVAAVSQDQTLRVYDSATGNRLTELRIDGELNVAAWLSPERLVAVGAHGVYWFSYVSS